MKLPDLRSALRKIDQIGGQRWVIALVALVLTLLTMPSLDPDHSVGLDPSYVWGFNYLFDKDYDTLVSLLHPYGPLAFLRIPVVGHGHYALFLLFYALLKFCFVWQALRLSNRRQQPFLVAVASLAVACLFCNTDLLVVFNVALMVLSVAEDKRLWLFLAATLLAVFSFSIKVSIGLQSSVVVFVGWLVILFRYKDIRFNIITAAMVPVAAFVTGILVWRSISDMWNAYCGMTHLFGGYNEAMVLNAGHRVWALLLFVLFLIAEMLTVKGKWSRILCLLLFLPLLANWKYGIVRDDIPHFKQLTSFCICFVVLTALSQDRFRWPAWCCGTAAVAMLLVNMSVINTSKASILNAKPSNLVSRIIKNKSMVESCKAYISEAMSTRVLDDGVRSTIGDSAVDCYPWEQVFIGANNFKWQPHKTLELGTGNTEWLNLLSAANYSKDGVPFVILHKPNYQNSDGLISIDGRYLLSDEPAIIDSLLANYTVADTGWYGLLLRRGNGCYLPASDTLASVTAHWGEWLEVPECQAGNIVRVAVKSSYSLLGELSKLLYKPDIFYIDYLMPDGTVKTYRYSRSTAECGLWCSPLVMTYRELAELFTGTGHSLTPTAIRLRTESMKVADSRSRLQKADIAVTFLQVLVR